MGSIRNVSLRLAVTLRLQVPFRSPVRVCAFQEQRAHLFRLLHVVQKAKHLAQLLYTVGWNSFCNVVHIELLDSLMEKISDSHLKECSP